MNKLISKVKQAGVGKGDWLKKKLIPILTLLLVIAISVALFFYGRKPEIVAELGKYRYLGAFLISVIGNATVLLPGIVLPILTALGVDFYQASGGLTGPIMIGLVGGAGAAIGEIVGYIAGYSGSRIAKRSKMYSRVESWMRRWGALAIFIFALVPLFFDLVGLVAGALRFPLWKFILLCWAGRTLLYVVIVVLAALGWEAALPYFG
jgi:membrane protein DedA with SNARE-associated domain